MKFICGESLLSVQSEVDGRLDFVLPYPLRKSWASMADQLCPHCRLSESLAFRVEGLGLSLNDTYFTDVSVGKYKYEPQASELFEF